MNAIKPCYILLTKSPEKSLQPQRSRRIQREIVGQKLNQTDMQLDGHCGLVVSKGKKKIVTISRSHIRPESQGQAEMESHCTETIGGVKEGSENLKTLRRPQENQQKVQVVKNTKGKQRQEGNHVGPQEHVVKMNFLEKFTQSPNAAQSKVPAIKVEIEGALIMKNRSTQTVSDTDSGNKCQIRASDLNESAMEDLETEFKVEVIQNMVDLRTSKRSENISSHNKRSGHLENSSGWEYKVMKIDDTVSPVVQRSTSDIVVPVSTAHFVDEYLGNNEFPIPPFSRLCNKYCKNCKTMKKLVAVASTSHSAKKQDQATVTLCNNNSDVQSLEINIPLEFADLIHNESNCYICKEQIEKIKTCLQDAMWKSLIQQFEAHKIQAEEAIQRHKEDLATVDNEIDLVVVCIEFGQTPFTRDLKRSHTIQYLNTSKQLNNRNDDSVILGTTEHINQMTSCLWKYFSKYKYLVPGKTRKLILWTDKNADTSTMLMSLLILLVRKNRFTSVIHKTFFHGHSIFEKDSGSKCPQIEKDMEVQQTCWLTNFTETFSKSQSFKASNVDQIANMEVCDFLDFTPVFQSIGCPSTLNFSKITSLKYERQNGGLIMTQDRFSTEWDRHLLPNYTQEMFNGQLLLQWDWGPVDFF